MIREDLVWPSLFTHQSLNIFRRPGASLIVIRGHHHLRQCAYIGDDSSEEEEELEEIRQYDRKNQSIPTKMHKAREGVQFLGDHHLQQGDDYLINKKLDSNDGDEVNIKLLDELKAKGKRRNPPLRKTSSVASDEVFKAVISKLKKYQSEGKLSKNGSIPNVKAVERWLGLRKMLENDLERDSEKTDEVSVENGSRARRHLRLFDAIQTELNQHDEDGNQAEEEVSI